MKELTKAEEQVMHILWKLEKVLLKTSLKRCQNPNLLTTRYQPLCGYWKPKDLLTTKRTAKHTNTSIIPMEKYKKFYLNTMIKGYFEGSSIT